MTDRKVVVVGCPKGGEDSIPEPVTKEWFGYLFMMYGVVFEAYPSEGEAFKGWTPKWVSNEEVIVPSEFSKNIPPEDQWDRRFQWQEDPMNPLRIFARQATAQREKLEARLAKIREALKGD